MQKITPFLWFDNQAEEAAQYYTSIFNNSKIISVSRYGEGPPGQAGTVMLVSFDIDGQQFTALNGGPEFNFTPAVSFFVNCATPQETDALWGKLTEGGKVLMELGSYPFSEKFGWVEDRFGVSWQLNLAEAAQKIVPFLMFVGEQCGKAEQAIRHYTSLFRNSGLISLERHGAGGQDVEGTVKHAIFSLHGQTFMAIDSNFEHRFTFTEATSFYVDCKDQREVDELWEKLSRGGETSQCGWLRDQYGLSWQIVPSKLGELMGDKDPEKSKRVVEAMLKMTKIDISLLQQAYDRN